MNSVYKYNFIYSSSQLQHVVLNHCLDIYYIYYRNGVIYTYPAGGLGEDIVKICYFYNQQDFEDWIESPLLHPETRDEIVTLRNKLITSDIEHFFLEKAQEYIFDIMSKNFEIRQDVLHWHWR